MGTKSDQLISSISTFLRASYAPATLQLASNPFDELVVKVLEAFRANESEVSTLFDSRRLIAYVTIEYLHGSEPLIGLDFATSLGAPTSIAIVVTYGIEATATYRLYDTDYLANCYLVTTTTDGVSSYALWHVPNCVSLSNYVTVSYGDRNRIEELLAEPSSVEYFLSDSDSSRSLGGICQVFPYSAIWPTVYGARKAVSDFEKTYGRSIVFQERFLPSQTAIAPSLVRSQALRNTPEVEPQLVLVSPWEDWKQFLRGEYLGRLLEEQGSLHMFLKVHEEEMWLPDCDMDVVGYYYVITYVFPETLTRVGGDILAASHH